MTTAVSASAPITPPRPIVAALAVVVRGRQIVMVRRARRPDAGLWGFPGGKIERGEPLLEAAVRELYEETGVTARAIEVLTAVDVIRKGADGQVAQHYVLIPVLCQWVAGDQPVAGDDADEAAWFDIDELLSPSTGKSANVDVVARQAVALASEHGWN